MFTGMPVAIEQLVAIIGAGKGHSESNYFPDVFRRHHGISPSEYRVKSRDQTL